MDDRRTGDVPKEMSGACVRSGYCCKRSPCPFGRWNRAKTQCDYLEGDRPGRYACGIYDEIRDEAGGGDFGPAFGAGCCAPLNTDRRVVQLETAGEIRNEDWPR